MVLVEGFEFANVKLLPGQEADLAELGIQIHKTPNDPEHATYEGRLQTFQGWPVDITQTPETLSNAGFYYTGQNYAFFLLWCINNV